MSKFKLGVGAVLIAWIGILGLAFHFLFHTTPPLSPDHDVALHDDAEDFAAGSLGSERRAELLADTRIYVAQHKDAAPAMAQGKELAPPDFLNQQLAAHNLKWRVSAVHGLDADIYDVS
ncbi:hypothetical protein [Novosphingobium album (ex Liu et al. 2023)]|uniref:Uncharacterized protein n=1 Tax=Novosphingobium album (ex Liu et al. 2023) TaxID=3031130 RepID=A0ABT5WMS1_9SPHN|nr:hypothetical protein [Novosphingobium album (ex Liu et al. 2023)]MDE8651352.1 hypothetical protein [Novosphingobium album (ex Liu et al. 2023)]